MLYVQVPLYIDWWKFTLIT